MNFILFKEFLYTLKRNLARFLSIVAIIALGVGFFAGISATKNDMILSADTYYKKHNLMDLRSMNPLGYTEREINEIKKVADIEILEEVYRSDVFIFQNDERLVTRVFSYDLDNGDQQVLNEVYLTEGRLPRNSGEIIISDERQENSGFEVGSSVSFVAPEDVETGDVLKETNYTIVGKFNSPLYISYEKEQTNIGSGKVQLIAYLPKEDFKLGKPSELFIKVKGSETLSPTSEEYYDRVEAVQDQVDEIGKKYMNIETAALRRSLEENKKELQDNKDEANRELLAAEEELIQAEIDITEGELALVEEETKAREEIAAGRQQVVSGRTELLNGRLQYNEAYLEWSAANNDYLSGKLQLDSSKQQLDGSRAQLDGSKQLLEQSKASLDSGKQQLDTMEEAIDAMDSILESIPEEPQISEEQYLEIIAQVRVYSEETANYLEQYLPYDTPGITSLMQTFINNYLDQLRATYDTSKIQYDEGLRQYNEGVEQLEEGERAYAEGLAQYEAGRAELEAGRPQLEQAKRELDQAKKTLDDSEAILNQSSFELDEGERELNEKIATGMADLEEAKLLYEEGKAEFDQEKIEILAQLAEADDELLKAERQIADIPEGWFVYTRENNPAYLSWFENADKIGQVALVFPVFFFIVAALVTLTNITRMVEEERSQMGTLKALGYGNNAIASKYILYALFAVLLGSGIGLGVGFSLFPSVIINAYRIMYNMPYLVLEFNLFYAALSFVFALLSTVGAALTAIFSEIYGKRPAQLMQPKAPAAGKRILLERISPLWKRLSFSHKVTFRNLFLYKKRFWMTVIGIAGCAALVLTGFGLRDSINSMVENQFKELFTYDGMLILDDKLEAHERKVEDILGNQNGISNYLAIMSKAMQVHEPASDRSYDATLIVPEKAANFENYIVLRDRVNHTPIHLEDDGLVINEKLADLLDLSIGDSLKYEDVDKRQFEGTIVAITENYVDNYIYMTPQHYQTRHLMKADYNAAFYNYNLDGMENDTAIRESILENDAALTIISTLDISDSFDDQLESLSLVVIVLVLSAGALAFIVLYNLSNVNITERQRELATIKVLGFRDNEVTAYVYRENIWLTVIGAALGLLVGYFLHRFVISTMELTNLMFGRHIHYSSYLIAVALTFVFSSIVNVIMHFELKRINMVEALKSVE